MQRTLGMFMQVLQKRERPVNHVSTRVQAAFANAIKSGKSELFKSAFAMLISCQNPNWRRLQGKAFNRVFSRAKECAYLLCVDFSLGGLVNGGWTDDHFYYHCNRWLQSVRPTL